MEPTWEMISNNSVAEFVLWIFLRTLVVMENNLKNLFMLAINI